MSLSLSLPLPILCLYGSLYIVEQRLHKLVVRFLMWRIYASIYMHIYVHKYDLQMHSIKSYIYIYPPDEESAYPYVIHTWLFRGIVIISAWNLHLWCSYLPCFGLSVECKHSRSTHLYFVQCCAWVPCSTWGGVCFV